MCGNVFSKTTWLGVSARTKARTRSSTTNIAHVEGGVATTATTSSLNFAIGVLTVALEVSCLDNVCLCVRVFGLCDA